MRLTDLRARWAIANGKVESLARTIDRCIAEAEPLEAGYLAQDAKATAALEVINAKYDRIYPWYLEAFDDQRAIGSIIRHSYLEAESKGLRIDWAKDIRLIAGQTRTSFDRALKHIDRLSISIELTEIELMIITDLIARSVRSPIVSIRPSEGRYLLIVERPTYGDICIDEMAAWQIMQAIAPIAENKRQQQIASTLPVLTVGVSWRQNQAI